MTVTGQSPWRSIGDLTPAQFKAQIPAGSPMLADAAAISAAVKGDSALYAAHAGHESEWGTTGEGANTADHNALGNKDHVNGGYMHFASWAEGATWWKQHVRDPHGPYAGTTSIADYVHVYAPASDGNDEARYVQVICDVANLVTAPATTPPASGGPPVATTPTVRGKVPLPPMIERWDVGNNHAIGTGRSDDGPRWGFIVGSCVHTSDGDFLSNLNSYLNPTFGGMTDAQIGGPWDGQYNGVIMRFIDPHSQVIPWANGGVGPNCDGCVEPHGDGPAFLAQFGSSGGIDWVVNGRPRSVETTDGRDPTVTKGGAQIEMLCFLLAYWHSEEAGQSWDQFSWRMSHWEFGGNHQQCPGTWIKAHEKDINDRTIAIMKAYQTGTALNPPLQVTYPPNWTGGTVPLPGTTPAPVPAPAPTPAYTAAVKPAFWDQLQADGMYVDRGTVWFSSHESYTAQKATPRSTYAALASTLRAGPDLAPGDVVNPNNEPVAVGTSSSGGQWVISNAPNFTRFNLADLKP